MAGEVVQFFVVAAAAVSTTTTSAVAAAELRLWTVDVVRLTFGSQVSSVEEWSEEILLEID